MSVKLSLAGDSLIFGAYYQYNPFTTVRLLRKEGPGIQKAFRDHEMIVRGRTPKDTVVEEATVIVRADPGKSDFHRVSETEIIEEVFNAVTEYTTNQPFSFFAFAEGMEVVVVSIGNLDETIDVIEPTAPTYSSQRPFPDGVTATGAVTPKRKLVLKLKDTTATPTQRSKPKLVLRNQPSQ